MNYSPKIIKRQEFKSFFGIDGAMPLCFSEMLSSDIISFFEIVFAQYIVNQWSRFLQNKNKQIHNFYQIIKKKGKKTEKIKIIKFKNKYNTIGKSKLSSMIIGGYILTESKKEINQSKLYLGTSVLK